MIKVKDNVFILETDNTSYIISLLPTGHIEHVYYGERVEIINNDISALQNKCVNINGSSILYSKEGERIGLDDIPLEYSGRGKGDFRESPIELIMPDGSRTTDFVFHSFEIKEGVVESKELPVSIDETSTAETLILKLKEKVRNIELYLYYSVFPKANTITRRSVIKNLEDEKIVIEKIMSAQIDFDENIYSMINFTGDWVREMNKTETRVLTGQFINSSNTGNSSNRANPFVIIKEEDTNENNGNCYASNLVYSGNHYESLSINGHLKTRFLTGINPDEFNFTLENGEAFESPEAVLTFSSNGLNGISKNMHTHVRDHIVRGEWKYKERPILLNSWEACYFHITEAKLLKLAKEAKDVGIELFVMDDGWFGERNDDTSSLGDWYVNKKKLPGGLSGLSKKIRALGLQFGLWVEPEMLNVNSELYRAHPDWAVQIDDREHGEGRQQMVLDFTRKEVRENIVEQMSKVFETEGLTYVKWDMNRHFSDVYSKKLPKERQKEFSHRYILGLYSVMKTLTEKFPHILFEGCASGGSRSDLGIISFFPQVWASDNSDAVSRLNIQNGYSYGYPQSVIGAHVSGCPNHQTLRNTPLDTRFNVASFGLLGYELHLAELTKEEKEEVKEQVEIYKKYRKTLQYGQMYRIQEGNSYKWMIVNEDKTEAVLMMAQLMCSAHLSFEKFKTIGLDDTKTYHFTNRTLKFNIKRFGDLINMVAPFHVKRNSFLHNTIARFMKMDSEVEDFTVKGSVLNNAGIKLSQGFAGTGYEKNTRLYQDYDSRLYFVSEVNNQ